MRILHFADLHLGVETYGHLDPETGLNTRVKDFSRSLAAGVDCAVSRGADLVLFCGDAYKTCDPSPSCLSVPASRKSSLHSSSPASVAVQSPAKHTSVIARCARFAANSLANVALVFELSVQIMTRRTAFTG